MSRYTEYHAGVAVIRDKRLQKKAMAKLAKIEDMEDIPETICDRYCKWPDILPRQEDLDVKCNSCKLTKLFEILN